MEVPPIQLHQHVGNCTNLTSTTNAAQKKTLLQVEKWRVMWILTWRCALEARRAGTEHPRSFSVRQKARCRGHRVGMPQHHGVHRQVATTPKRLSLTMLT